MKSIVNVYFTLIAGIISLASLLAIILIFNLSPDVVIVKSNLQLIPFFGFIISFLFHLLSLIFLLQSFKNSAKYKGFKIFTLIVFVFSVISFLVDKVMIDELADEIRYGFDLSLIMLNIPLVFVKS